MGCFYDCNPFMVSKICAQKNPIDLFKNCKF